MMTLKIERVKSKVKTVSMQRNTAVFLAVLQNILTLREGFKKNKKQARAELGQAQGLA